MAVKNRSSYANFIENVNRLLRSKDMSRVDLAEKLGKHKSFITQSLGGDQSPRLETIDAIAKALGVQPKELIE